MKKGQKSKDPKYLKNHPDITGMMSDSGSKDKDEEEMLNDISGKGSGEDPTDSIDREMEDKPEKKPKEKVNVQTEVTEQSGAEEDADLQAFIQSKEKETIKEKEQTKEDT